MSLAFSAVAGCGGTQTPDEEPDTGTDEPAPRAEPPRPYTQSAASLANGGEPVLPRPEGPELRQLEAVMRDFCREWDRCGYGGYGYYGYGGNNTADDPVEACVRTRVQRYSQGYSYRSPDCTAAWIAYNICQLEGVVCTGSYLRYDYNADCYQLYDAINRECYGY